MARFFKQLAVFGALVALLFVLYYYQVPVVRIFARGGAFLSDFARGSGNEGKILALESENQKLRNELSLLADRPKASTEDRYRYKVAEVYSRYPFNDQGKLFLNLGSSDGIREGMPVFVEKGVLLGKITKIHRTQSEVETIFGTQWKTSVTVGEGKVKAVYAGGTSPELDFIPKDEKVSVGDRILSVSPDVPLGALLGKVAEVDSESYDVWQKAKVEPLFSPESFSTVLVLTDFP